MASVTYLETLETSEKNEIKTDDSKDENHRKNAIDLFLPLHERLHSLSLYYKTEGETVGELISCIVGMYFFSKTKNLAEYIQAICSLTDIPIIYRIDCAKQLDGDIGYTLLNNMFANEIAEISALPTPLRVATIIYLMKSTKYELESSNYFCLSISDTSIDVVYRYRIIQSLEQHFKDDKFLFYVRNACNQFIDNQGNTYTYRAIACQYMFEKCTPDEPTRQRMEQFLLQIADDITIAEDTRADACDILLQNGRDESRALARNALFVLAGGEMARSNIFKNSQNVHVRSIEESVEKLVEKLSTYHPRNETVYDFDTTREKLLEKIGKTHEHREDVEGALLRIVIDRAVYGHSNMTLTTILAKMWTYIQDSEHREELEKRLVEELIESNNKCSSGYVSRIVNTLSGFDEQMSISISFEDQIIANLEGRLNACITRMEDPDEMDEILHQMTIPVIHYNLRGAFLKFFRENISFIREGMYDEFRHFMTDLDYDFYFRKAIIHYEGCY
uniref:Uncharacterized protein n=1 Tax=viral metagenome TaxID=1070528 RepID=A0A6C0KFX0_9ZZZZ